MSDRKKLINLIFQQNNYIKQRVLWFFLLNDTLLIQLYVPKSSKKEIIPFLIQKANISKSRKDFLSQKQFL